MEFIVYIFKPIVILCCGLLVLTKLTVADSPPVLERHTFESCLEPGTYCTEACFCDPDSLFCQPCLAICSGGFDEYCAVLCPEFNISREDRTNEKIYLQANKTEDKASVYKKAIDHKDDILLAITIGLLLVIALCLGLVAFVIIRKRHNTKSHTIHLTTLLLWTKSELKSTRLISTADRSPIFAPGSARTREA